MARKLKSDKVLFFATLLLVFASIVMVYSASAVMAHGAFPPPVPVPDQAVDVGCARPRRPGDRHARGLPPVPAAGRHLGVTRPSSASGCASCCSARPINGTRRWFGLGGFGVQPSELAKLSLILFTAALLERRMHRVNDLRYALLPIALVSAIVVVLVLLEPDFGTAVSMLIVVALMVFAAGLDWRYFAAVALAAIPTLARDRDRGSLPPAPRHHLPESGCRSAG